MKRFNRENIDRERGSMELSILWKNSVETHLNPKIFIKF